MGWGGSSVRVGGGDWEEKGGRGMKNRRLERWGDRGRSGGWG